MLAAFSLRPVISQRMYLSIWFGILMSSAGCSSTDKQPSHSDLAEVRKATLAEDAKLQDNPLAKRLNKKIMCVETRPA